MRILILGAGPTGLGAAYRLAELGHSDWELWEAGPAAGGLAGSVTDEHGFVWDMGGHVQFSHYAKFDAMMDEALGPDGWLHHERESWIRIRGGWVPYPFQYNLHRLPKEDALRCFHGLIDVSKTSRPARYENFERMIQGDFGEGIAELFMMPYNFKVWAYPPADLSADWTGERVAIPDLKRVAEALLLNKDDVSWGPNNTFRFPKYGGTGAIWRAIAERLPQERLKFNRRAERVDVAARTVHAADGSAFRYDALISTLPLDQLAQLTGRADLIDGARGLRYSSTHIFGVGLRGAPGPELERKCWMYFPEANSPFYRVTVFSHYSPNNVPDIANQWSLMAEVSESRAKPVDATKLEDEVIEGMINTGLITGRDQVHHIWKTRLERGYPTPSLHRDAALAMLLPALDREGILSRGRFGAWKYEVSNQDHSCMQGIEAVDRLLGGAPEPTLNDPNGVNAMRWKSASGAATQLAAEGEGSESSAIATPSSERQDSGSVGRMIKYLTRPGPLFLLYFGLIALTLRHSLNQGFVSDAIGYMADASEMMSQHPWRPYMDPNFHSDPGHPLMMTWLVGVQWRLMGQSTWFPHLLVWLGAALALWATHRAASIILGADAPSPARRQMPGFVAALMLFAHPLFIGHAAQFLSEVPVTGFIAALYLAELTKNRRAVTLWGTLIVFQKLTGVISLAPFGAARLIECLCDRELRRPRRLLFEVTPYLIPPFLLGIYLIIKTRVLGQPLTTFDVNWGWNTDLKGFLGEWAMVWDGMVNFPRLGVGPLMIVALAGMCWRIVEFADRREAFAGSALRLHLFNLTLWVTTFLFFTFHKMYDLPRYYIFLYPLLIIAALDGAIQLARRKTLLWLAPAILWTALQVTRWYDDWLDPFRDTAPKLHAELAMPNPEMNLSVMERAAATKKVATQLTKKSPDALIIAKFPMSQALAFTRSGHVKKPLKVANVDSLKDKDAFLAKVREQRIGDQDVLVVVTSWEYLGLENRTAIETWPETETLRSTYLSGKGWVRVYRVKLGPSQ